jgi:hypothetical protein
MMKQRPFNNLRDRLIGLFLLVACLATGDALALTLTPVKVAPDVYAFIGDTGGRTYENYGMNANTGFIVTPGGVAVIDSGAGYLAAQAMHHAIKKVTRQPVKYVVNTGGQGPPLARQRLFQGAGRGNHRRTTGACRHGTAGRNAA